MKANELLFWLSARREGSWQRFREAVEELHSATDETDAGDTNEFPLHQQLRLDLERLAHVEFFASDCKKGWRVVPPTLAAHQVPDGVRAVLCGARSPALCERVICAAKNLGCETIESSSTPEMIRVVAADAPALAELAADTGVCFQPDAPLAILSHLPPCDPPARKGKQTEFPVGVDWNIHEFDTQALCWQATDHRGAQTVHTGLFRFTHRYQRPCYFLRWLGATFTLPRAIAVYALLRRNRRELLRYDATARTLDLPAICRPPRLLERSLVLCSGSPPVFSTTTARLTYTDVPPEIARFAAELLRQGLQ